VTDLEGQAHLGVLGASILSLKKRYAILARRTVHRRIKPLDALLARAQRLIGQSADQAQWVVPGIRFSNRL
jgi:hypothetical protein